MNYRNRIVLTTVAEDFEAIGLLPKRRLDEVDDPSKPRDIPSPDPSTLGGLDDSEGEKSAHQAGAKQPKPKMGPPADDSGEEYDPDEDGGSAGAQKGKSGSYHKVPGGKEASLESKQYMAAKKQPMAKVKGKNKGEKAQLAQGLKPAKKVGGMHKEGRLGKAANLIEDVENLLRGIQIDEEMDNLMRGFSLVAENSSLLADRLTEIAHRYELDFLISQMEELSRDAVEALSVLEGELENVGDDGDESQAIGHSADVAEVESRDPKKSDRDADEPYDVPSPAFKEEGERLYHAMVAKLMDGMEMYDGALDDMAGEHGGGDGETEGETGDEDGKAVHHHQHDHVHVHQHGGEDSDQDADDQGDGEEMSAHGDQDADDQDGGEEDPSDQDGDDDQDDGGSDNDHNSLMARMKALKARRSSMGGGKPFRGADEGGNY